MRYLNPILHKIGKSEVQEIRQNIDWRDLFPALDIVRDETRSRAHDWWARSPFSEDVRPSFHVNNDGWYCQSTKQGGGPLELIQEILSLREGKRVNIFQAAAWAVDAGISHFAETETGRGGSATGGEVKKGKPKAKTEMRNSGAYSDAPREVVKVNTPVRQDLVPMLHPEHAYFADRGISAATARKLRCGFLPEGKSQLSGRVVFQIRGCEVKGEAISTPILTHIGRAVTEEQAAQRGKWSFYKGFHKSVEVFHLDRVLGNREVKEKVRAAGRIILVEGCTDIAKLVEAGVDNCVASFGADLSEAQVRKLGLLRDVLGMSAVTVMFDRDKAGQRAAEAAVALLDGVGWDVSAFDWSQALGTRSGVDVFIPSETRDPCDLSVDQIKWLQGQGRI